jgi:hypothetical protein
MLIIDSPMSHPEGRIRFTLQGPNFEDRSQNDQS